jgi:hypothetical protein
VAWAQRKSTSPNPKSRFSNSVPFRPPPSKPAAGFPSLKRIGVQSVGAGAYTVPATSQAVSMSVTPDSFESVDFWVPAFVEFRTTLGSNGPVTLRLTLQFDSTVGQFQEVVVRQVSASGVAGTRGD